MRVLFAHTNFPAQFGAFGAWLARQGWDVTYATAREGAKPPEGTKMFRFNSVEQGAEATHRHARPLDRALSTAEAFAAGAIPLRNDGYRPDVVMAHSGWGAGTYAKAVFPDAAYVPYLEWWYNYPAVDRHPTDLFPEDDAGSRAKALSRNAPMLVDLVAADACVCPTHFQAERFPDWIRSRIEIMHDGVDTQYFAPDPEARNNLPVDLPDNAEIVTYATRGMEPYRGFPEFLRAVEILMTKRPNLHVLIAGEDRVAYGVQLPKGESWKTRMLAELDLDESRLHFLGLLPFPQYRTLLQAADVHTYLTVPFVLSWSMIEAMATGTPLVVSNTEPVREALPEDHMAFHVDHYDTDALADRIAEALDNRDEAEKRGNAARAHASAAFDRRWLWPAKANFLRSLT